MNPDNQRPKIEPSKEFVKELDTKEVLAAPVPVQPTPFSDTQNQPQPVESVATKPGEPVLESVIHHPSRPLEAPVEPKQEEAKRDRSFRVASWLIVVFASIALVWCGWNSYIEIGKLLSFSQSTTSSMLTYVPAALAVVGLLASIGMFFKKNIARIVYLSVAFGYLCLVVYFLYMLVSVTFTYGVAWMSFLSLSLVLSGTGLLIVGYLISSIVTFLFLFNKHISAAFWR